MSVKRGNLRADTVVKNYWRNNEQFADFFNAVLFDGEQVIKPDELIPVITIVVYYGEKSWDGAASLHEMLNIPKTMESFVNDYKMHLVEARKNDLKLHNINNQDLFNLLEIILDKSAKWNVIREKAINDYFIMLSDIQYSLLLKINYARKHEVEKSVIMTVAGAANCKMDYNMMEKKGDADMCTVFEETRKEGVAEGVVKGRAEEIIETGYEFGLSEDDILTRLQKKLNISLQKAQEYLSMFGKQTVQSGQFLLRRRKSTEKRCAGAGNRYQNMV